MTAAVASADSGADATPPDDTALPPPPPSPSWRPDELARTAGVAGAVALGAAVAWMGSVPLRAHPPVLPRAAPFDYPWVDTAAAAAAAAATNTASTTTTTTAVAAAVDAARRWSAWLLYAAHQGGHWALIWVTTSRGGGGGCGRRPPRGAAAAPYGLTARIGRSSLNEDCPGAVPLAAASCAAAATAAAGAGAGAAPAVVPPDAHRLRWWHVATLALHAVFCTARVAHTRWVSYDGLARDVHEASALGAVAMLLVWVWLLRSPERGVFAGARLARLLPGGPRAAATVVHAAVAAHSWAFSAACVWTLWYHPAVATPAHVTGFVYIAALLVQSALAGTAAHVGPAWMTALEVGVGAHALVTAAAAARPSTAAAAGGG